MPVINKSAWLIIFIKNGRLEVIANSLNALKLSNGRAVKNLKYFLKQKIKKPRENLVVLWASAESQGHVTPSPSQGLPPGRHSVSLSCHWGWCCWTEDSSTAHCPCIESLWALSKNPLGQVTSPLWASVKGESHYNSLLGLLGGLWRGEQNLKTTTTNKQKSYHNSKVLALQTFNNLRSPSELMGTQWEPKKQNF